MRYFLRESTEIKTKVKELVARQDPRELDEHLWAKYSRESGKAEHAKPIMQYTKGSKELNESLYFGRKTNFVRDLVPHLDRALRACKTERDMVVYSGVKWNPAKHLEERHLNNPEEPIKVKLPAYTSTTIAPGIAHGFGRPFMNENPHPHVPHQYFYAHGDTQHKAVPFNESEAKEYEQHMDNDDLHARANGITSVVNKLRQRINLPETTGRHHTITSTKFYPHVIDIHVPKGTGGVYTKPFSKYDFENEFLLPRNTHLHIHPVPEINTERSAIVWHARVVPKPTRKKTTE